LVVTSSAAGTSDAMARTMAAQVEKRIGGNFVVDNRGGAGGIIATDIVAKSVPDGYTLLHATAAFATNAALYPKLPYDSLKDLAPIADLAVSTGYLLLVNAAVAANNFGELIELAKKKPGHLNYASPGHGHVLHLAGEMLNLRAGIKTTHIPYKGVGPMLGALVSGEVQVLMVPALVSAPYLKGGKIRALAFTGTERLSSLPDVPTVAESGMPGFTIAGGWQGWFAPAKTPDAIVNRINVAIRDSLQAPDIRKSLLAGGYEPGRGTPADFRKTIVAEIGHYREIVKKTGIKPE